MKFRRAFSHEIFTARHELQLTQEAVADLAGISVRWYQMIENGSRAPSSILLLRLCSILQIDASIFYNCVGLDCD